MQKLTVQGKVLVVVTIADCQYSVVCVVVEVLSYPIILGWDGFLVKYHAVIDSVKKNVRLLKPSTSNDRYLYLEDSITVPPFTERVAAVHIHRNEHIKANEIFVSRYDPLFIRTGLTVLPGIQRHKNEDVTQLNVVLTNLSEQSVTLGKFSIVAIVEPFENTINSQLNLIEKDVISRDFLDISIDNLDKG